MPPATPLIVLASSVIGPIVVFASIALVSGALLYAALRKRGLTPPLTCVCGYSLEGNESGKCPECGVGLSEALDRRERVRILRAIRRAAMGGVAVALLLAVAAIVVASRIGELSYTDCRAVLVPDSPIYQQAELLWQLRGDRPRDAAVDTVRVVVTLPGGASETRGFGRESVGTSHVADWVQSLPIRTMTPPSDAPVELGRLVDTALGGAEVVVVDSVSRRHALLAMGSVVTHAERRWLNMTLIGITLVGAAATSVWVLRRALRASEPPPVEA